MSQNMVSSWYFFMGTQKKTMQDRIRQLMRCFVWSAGLRDAIAHGNTREYMAFKRHFKRHFVRENQGPFRDTLSVVAICKNEGAYLAEWLVYHRLVGVDRFYIYDNASTDNTREVLEPFIREGWVVYTPWPYARQQIQAYNDALPKVRLSTQWLAIIDLDEFIVPVAKKTIPEILDDYRDEVGLSAHWVFYGDNGHATKTSGLVIERFTARAAVPEPFVKAIVNPRAAFALRGHHGCYVGNRSGVNEQGVKVRSQTDQASMARIRINHYWGKSWEEYCEKQAKGRADDAKPLPADDSKFKGHNRNEVQDPIMAQYIPRIQNELIRYGRLAQQENA